MNTFVKWDTKALMRERNELYYIKILRTFHQKSLKVKRQATGWKVCIIHRSNGCLKHTIYNQLQIEKVQRKRQNWQFLRVLK